MLTTLKMVLSPLTAILLLMLGNGFFLSFTSIRLHSLQVDEWVIGFVHSAYYLGMLIGAARAEKVINRVGHIRAYTAYAGIGTACLMLQGLFEHPFAWICLRLTAGFCVAVYYIVVESWLLTSATPKTRGVLLSVYMVTLYFSQAMSQFIIDLIDLDGAEPFFVSALLSSISAVPLALTRSVSPHIHEHSGHSLRSLYKKSHFGFLGCVLSGMILSSIYSFAPIFAETNAMPVSGVMSSCIFGGVFLQWPVGKLSDLMDRRKTLFGVAVATALHALIIVFFELRGIWLYSYLFAMGGLTFTLYPLSISEVCDRLQPEDITKATGMLLLAYGIGAVMGPYTCAILY